MYRNNTPYISAHYSKQDYINLHLSLNSDNETFERAIEIFTDRIRSRFIDQIHLLCNTNNGYDINGFSIMALECLLVETFAQFKHGLNDTKGVSRDVYSRFLYNDLNCFPSLTVAKKFYSDIRCGILHQAQTKPNSALTFNKADAIQWENNFLMVSVDRFADKMDTYFSEYCNQLRDINQVDLRTNFIRKMDFICHR